VVAASGGVPPGRAEGLQALRALAAVGVVLFHANNYFLPVMILRGEDAGNFWRLGQHGVELFFVLSGFLVLRRHGGEIGAPGRSLAFLGRRFGRIYPFYWLVLAAVVLGLALEPRFGATRIGVASLAESVSLLPGPGEPVMRVTWTLQHEVMFYLAFALLIARPVWGGWLVGLWMAGCAIAALAGPVVPALDQVLSPFNLCFGVGMLAARLARPMARGTGPALVFLGAAIFLAGAWGEIEGPPWGEGPRVAIFGLGSALLVLGLSGPARVPRPLVFAGEASYAIYLMHGAALTLLAHALAATGAPETAPPGMILALVAGLAVAVGLVAHVAVERPSRAMIRDGAARSLVAAPVQAGRRRS
jgi:peptidoglycan/LPS O-acetylase OafA/YrhL